MDRLEIDMPAELGQVSLSPQEEGGETAASNPLSSQPPSTEVGRFVGWFDCWSNSFFNR